MFVEQRLSIDKHFRIVGEFSCGADNPLNGFLTSDAFEYDNQRYGNTYVCLLGQDENEIVGFYTLKTSGIQIEENGEYNSIPVIEIARIAVSHDFQAVGVGKYIFYEHILPKIMKVSDIVAVRAIIAFVDPSDEKAVGFYTSIGFVKASDEVQKEIEDSFNEKCDLYLVALDDVMK